ncbi:MAG: hypothetical protein AABX11_05315 [Nanoarchaeota archaeon]
MDNYVKVIIGLIILVGVLGGIFLFKNVNLGPSQSQLEECKTLVSSEYKEGGIVMFTDKNTAEKYTKELLNTYPFNDNKTPFSIFYIDSYTPNCTLYKDIALYCDSKELRKKAASCPADYIVAFESKGANTRSSSYMNTMSINKNHPLSVLLHEFGHSFANLEEEYISGSVGSKKMNCLSSCDAFGEKSDGCFQGCSENGLYRSIESGVMKTLASNVYGKYDSWLISKQLSKITGNTITGNVVTHDSSCAGQYFYIVESRIKDGQIVIERIIPTEGCSSSPMDAPESREYINWTFGEVRGAIEPTLIYTDSQSPEENEISGELFNYEGLFYFDIPKADSESELILTNSTDNSVLARSRLHSLEETPCEI